MTPIELVAIGAGGMAYASIGVYGAYWWTKDAEGSVQKACALVSAAFWLPVLVIALAIEVFYAVFH